MSSVCSEIIDDIEDLVSSQDITPKERYSSRKSVNVRAKRNKKGHQSAVEPIIPLPGSYLPGCGRVWVKTWGCSHNSSDAEYMSGLLAAQGYNLADDPIQADLWLLNSCTVKNPAEDHFRNQIEKGLELGKRVVVAGCVPQAAPRAKYLRGLSLVGVQQIDRIVEVVEETFKGNTVRLFGSKKSPEGGKAGGASLALPKVRRNPLIEIISISTGCLNQCTYCKTKHARGELGSYPPEEIVARLRQCAFEGCVEIWLTSEDTGAYGKDIGTSLPDLLELLTNELDKLSGDMRLRLGMTNPPYILEHLPRMAKILNHPKVYKFLHVPVQSGSDEVLAEMRREYNVSEFTHLVDYLQEHVPGITIATDIICGFPTESEADWAGTVSLCARYRFKSLFINQFYPRPGTPAARLPQLPAATLKLRTRTLTELFHSYQPYEDRVGEMYEVLVTETSSDGRYYVGHNQFYEQVLVPLEPRYLGAHLTVRITDVSKWSMKGEVVGDPRPARITIETNIPTEKVLSNGPGGRTQQTDVICASRLSAPSYAICAIIIAIALRVVWFLI